MKSLSEKMRESSDKITEAICSYIPVTDAAYRSVVEAARYSSCNGGKRVRPFLTLEFAKMLGGSEASALPYACAIEMVHTYSLIHDDLPCIDNDDYRRGKPSCHKAYGEATALLAGDALLTAAFGTAASNRYVTADMNMKAVKLLSDAAGYSGMIGGQVIDIISENEKLPAQTFMEMNRLKTGCLIKAACLLGCISAGYGESSTEYGYAEKYAMNVGLAFQIEDDLLDIGTEDNKATFLSFMSREQAVSKIDELTCEAVNAVGHFEGSETLKELARYLAVRKA